MNNFLLSSEREEDVVKKLPKGQTDEADEAGERLEGVYPRLG